MKIRLLICAALLALASGTATPALAQVPAPLPRTLTVTGEGRADGVPDQAEISAGVVAEGATAAAAITGWRSR